MDYNINKETLAVNETVFESCMEQPVDLDFSLPDYCPDIQRILKCQIIPSISARNITADRLDVDGNATISLLYLTTDKASIKSCEHTLPFSASFNLKNVPENPLIFTKTKVEYLNCRALSPRRLDIHGSFSVCAKVNCKVSKNFVSDINGKGVQQKKVKVDASNVIGMGQQPFTISEIIDTGKSGEEIHSIIKTDLTTTLSDCKTLANKVIVNAVANLKVLYINDLEDSNIEQFSYEIPISQIIDIEGIDENCICDIKIETLSHDIQLKPNASGENTLMSADFKIVISAVAFEDTQIEMLIDAYSTEYETENKYERCSIQKTLDGIDDNFSINENISLTDTEVSEIIDVFGNIISISNTTENNQLIFKGKLSLGILALDMDNVPFYTERVVDFEYAKDKENGVSDISCDSEIIITFINAKIINSKNIEIKADLRLISSLQSDNKLNSIVDIKPIADKPKIKDKDAAITIYYADKGEKLWDIARKYCTCVNKIMQENDLQDDVISSRRMILISM